MPMPKSMPKSKTETETAIGSGSETPMQQPEKCNLSASMDFFIESLQATIDHRFFPPIAATNFDFFFEISWQDQSRAPLSRAQ
mmetsp:Transcript_29322/g.63114  ORF Transcript_29322/g.63114 Transcript_29322/m.63114 type:complete len:83 (-) Transcript_29322:2102-2350(-)